ncbi:vomeronasal type-2 receptor 26-like [Pituophis catenifer annectens]|uniref:vomeronasal type-2 receptor 26-like n=1 Tax=Pituophis catenifer annectens TaxID=94852 RepID=UPI003993A728
MQSEPHSILHEWHKPGDIIIGGITSHIIPLLSEITFTKVPSQEWIYIPILITKFIQHILALVFAIDEINDNPDLLPNVTLGFHIHDSYTDSRTTFRATLDLLSKSHQFLPNYKCGSNGKLTGVIGGLSADTSLCMEEILGLYKVPQLSYGSFQPTVNYDSHFSSFYRMVPNEALQLRGIVQLLLHFRWKWVGLVSIDDQSGERFLEVLQPVLSQQGICSAFIKRIPKTHPICSIEEILEGIPNHISVFQNSRANAVVVYGETVTLFWLADLLWWNDIGMSLLTSEQKFNVSSGKVWISTAQIDFVFNKFQKDFNIQIFHGTLSFSIHSKKVLAFEEFLQKVKPSLANGNSFINNFWENAFTCSISNTTTIDDCTGEEMLQNLSTTIFEISMTGHSYSIYNAVYAMAHVLDTMYSSNRRFKAVPRSQDIEPWQLHSLLQKISFNNSVGDEVTLNDHGEVMDGFDLINLITFPNGSYTKVKVGRLNPKTLSEKEFVVTDERIQWHGDFRQVPPTSLCNDPCQPGFHKVKKEAEPFCCYDCFRCEEEKISYLMDMDDCISCPDDHYVKDGENVCIPKVIHFLSYKEPLGITLASFTISLSLTASFVLGVFMKYQHTPIVKANNQSLSYSLLVSLILSFLCAFFFFDRPIQITCLLRQTSFGIIFSVAISCILAKTIMVILAFLAIQPHSKMSKWMGRKLPIFIVLSCSLVQAGILATWLGSSPPFPDVNMHTLEEEIILECNEGSTKMFYCVLGYMGFLSIVSFFVAFLAKNLPGSFNEAKFITFSMLVFCSVWLSFVPTYMSTKGKYMVVVEVFSILASSTGLLSCIFFPKCYVILLRPDLNRREQLIKKKK